jgi:UDP-2,3-diacylglucosamine hydrolase
MATLFISDLHLDTDRPTGIDRFLTFVEKEARDATALYILGDLFEAWIGDDDSNAGYAPVVSALADLKLHGVPCFFMHGNRDFLIGERFATATGCSLLTDTEVLTFDGERVLVTHGDLLCTDDKPYQALRAEVRSKQWQRDFLSKPIDERRCIAADLREKSREATSNKAEEIMDVNQSTVEASMLKYNVSTMLHGHTHRPDIHRFMLAGKQAVRIVLGAWHERGSVLRWDDRGFRLEALDY